MRSETNLDRARAAYIAALDAYILAPTRKNKGAIKAAKAKYKAFGGNTTEHTFR